MESRAIKTVMVLGSGPHTIHLEEVLAKELTNNGHKCNLVLSDDLDPEMVKRFTAGVESLSLPALEMGELITPMSCDDSFNHEPKPFYVSRKKGEGKARSFGQGKHSKARWRRK